MSVKLLNEQHLEFLSRKEGPQARLNLHLSKCHIVENHMSRLIFLVYKALLNRKFHISQNSH